jgi:ABC-2 type transport system permease protein
MTILRASESAPGAGIVVAVPHALPDGPQTVPRRSTAAGAGRQFALTGAAFFKRDLRADLSYRLSFALHALNILLGVGAYYFLARFVDRAALRGAEPFPFLLVGLAVNAYMSGWLVCFTEAIRSGQTTGTLKLVFASPTSGARFILFSALYPSARAAIEAGIYLLGGLALGASLAHANLAAAGVIFVLASLAFAAIGVASAAFALVLKRGDPVLWLVASLSWMLGGVLCPIELLPASLQQVARLLPITHAVSGARLALLDGGSIAGSAAPLGLFALIGLPVAVAVFGAALRHARAAGSLGHV